MFSGENVCHLPMESHHKMKARLVQVDNELCNPCQFVIDIFAKFDLINPFTPIRFALEDKSEIMCSSYPVFITSQLPITS